MASGRHGSSRARLGAGNAFASRRVPAFPYADPSHGLRTRSLSDKPMNLKEICQTLSREIQKLVPYDRAAINILQRDEKFFSVYAEESRLPAPVVPEGVSVREGTATSWVFDHKEPLICRDVLKDPRFPLTHKRYKNVGLRSYVILPLMVKGKVLGALNLGSLKPRCYGKKEIKILSPIAEILSLAIENSNLYQESERREETQKLLKELSQATTLLSIDRLLKKLTENVQELLRVDVCDIRMLEGEQWSLMAISGIDPTFTSPTRDKTPYGRLEWIIENRKPLMIPDSSQEGTIPPGETIKALGCRGYLGVPMLSRSGKVTGVIRALTYQPRQFSQEEVELLQQLSSSATIAIENAKLLEELNVKSQELQAANLHLNRLLNEQNTLREISSAINLLDLDQLLPQLAEQTLKLLNANHVAVRLIGKDRSLYTVALAGKGAERLGELRGMSGTRRSTWVMENLRPLAIKDITQDKVFGPGHLMRELGVRGYLCIPLISRDQKLIGTLQITTLIEREFTPEEIALAQQLAAGAAVAIENARLFEEVQKKSQELEEAYKTKSAFLNTMAHELRTPLNVLIATMQLFRDGFYGALSEKHITGFETMERNARNLLDLISGILELARLEAKRIPLQIEEFLFKEIIDELESSFMPLVREKGLELRFRLDDPMIKLKTDKSKIKAIIQNLLGNAVKYTDSGEIEVRVSALLDGQASGSQGKSLSILVRDTGIGIKESDLPHIFQAFYLAEGVNRRKYPGSGLGLSIVERLLKMLGGNIQAQSEWGKGSTFTVTLPLIHPSGL